MGGGNSRRRKPSTPIPNYNANANQSPGISRPGMGNVSGGNVNQQQELVQARQRIADLTQQLNAARGVSGGMAIPPGPYGNYSPSGGMSPAGYGTPPYSPPSPLLQNVGGQSSYPYHLPLAAGNAYRDTDFAAIANISGLNPGDVALLHREFMNLTRSGSNKMDRIAFRQILRDVLLQSNNEHVDRVIENMFTTIDRNHDGFIDFPEFIGAFKDVLKQSPSNTHTYSEEHAYPDIMTAQLRAAGVGTGIGAQPISYIQHAQPAGQLVQTGGLNIVPLASTAIQHAPIVYGGAAAHLQMTDARAPLITLDANQSSYVIATPGQYLITQPTALQCVPLPMM